ncbi:MAG TPA: ABC transporter ATP-binding protein [Steroidobacteraceae bacterium]|nr:ABC transporter ATP-binding protein [Steroidobacteraceae bacterium]
MNEIAVRAESLTRDFGPIRAVDGLTLEIPRGIVFGFLGPNGSGKTTTIRLLLGLLEPTSGRAEVLGYDTVRQAEEIRRRTGALLEYSGLYERLSAEENLDFYGRIARIPAAARSKRIAELLDHLGLYGRRGEAAGTWSRGMKQKLAVARALLHEPALIFLDEPTAGLDPEAAASLREDLARLSAREGVTVFLTTHNLAEAERLCQRVGVIRDGKLLADGHPDDLRRRTGSPRLEVIGTGFSADLLAVLRARPEVAAAAQENGRLVVDLHGEAPGAPLVSLIAGAGAQIEEIHRGAESLEQVFLALTREGS